MPETAKCPKCGADANGIASPYGDSWDCGSRTFNDRDEFHQSDKCRIAELTRENERLNDRIREQAQQICTDDDEIENLQAQLARVTLERDEGARYIRVLLDQLTSGPSSVAEIEAEDYLSRLDQPQEKRDA